MSCIPVSVRTGCGKPDPQHEAFWRNELIGKILVKSMDKMPHAGIQREAKL
jgi:hypothetical protein